MLNRFYLDFDGTLSGRAGGACVFSSFYKSLQLNPAEYYSNAQFKDNMVALVKAGLALPENKTMGMSEGALQFLKTMITQGADLNIVSGNRKEYIKAVLLAEGMEAELIEKITICDVNDMTTGKYQAVVDLEKRKKTPAGTTIICDDNAGDCKAMSQAVKDTNGATTIISYPLPPGTFNWKKIAQDAPQPTKLTTIPVTYAENYDSAQDWEDFAELQASRKTEKIQKQYDKMKTKSFCTIPFDDDDCYLPKRKPAKFIDRLVELDFKKQNEVIQAQANLSDGKNNIEDIYRMLNSRVKYNIGNQPTPELLNLVKTTLANLQTPPQVEVGRKFTA